MTLRPLHLCGEAGCTALTREPRCETHKATGGRNKPGDPFYSGRRWRKLRAKYLRSFPLCADCLVSGQVQPATEVHHIEKRKDNPARQYDSTNLMGLCKSCHSERTARGE